MRNNSQYKKTLVTLGPPPAPPKKPEEKKVDEKKSDEKKPDGKKAEAHIQMPYVLVMWSRKTPFAL